MLRFTLLNIWRSMLLSFVIKLLLQGTNTVLVFVLFLHVLRQLSCYLVTSEMCLLPSLYYSYMNSWVWMSQYPHSVQWEPKRLPENYEISSLTPKQETTLSFTAKSQPGVIVSNREYSAVSGDIFDVETRGREVLLPASSGLKPRMLWNALLCGGKSATARKIQPKC